MPLAQIAKEESDEPEAEFEDWAGEREHGPGV